MSNNESFPYLIDRIIADFTGSSAIIAIVRMDETLTTDPDLQEFEIVSVNGFKCLEQFTHYLEHLGGEIEKDARECLDKLEPEDKACFLSELKRQLMTLPDMFIKQDFTDLYRHLIREKLRFLLKFNHLQVRNENDQEITFSSVEKIEARLAPYAQCWSRVLEQLCSRIMMLEMIVEYVPMKPSKTRVVKMPKVVLQATVSQIALLLRLFFEDRLIECNNKAELCRIICEHFTVSSGDSISPNSFKNNFHTPDADALGFWDDELPKIKEIIRELWTRYHAN